MDKKAADPASTMIGEREPAQDDEAERDRELAVLLNEIEEQLAEEAGYGHGV